MGSPNSAKIAELSAAMGLTPTADQWRELGRLHEDADNLEQAAQCYERSLASSFRADVCHALFDLHMVRGALDAAWCSAAVLCELELELSEVERAFYLDHVPRRLRAPRAPLDAAGWQRLRHPHDDPALLALCDPERPTPGTTSPLEDPASAFARGLLGLPSAGPELELPTTLDEPLRRQLFDAGFAAASLADPARTGPPSGSTFLIDAATIERLREGSHQTAWRAGLLVCGDVRTAIEALRELPNTPQEKARLSLERMAFACSSDYVALRAQLRLGIDALDDGPAEPGAAGG